MDNHAENPNIESRPVFRPFDSHGEFHMYVRNLPHWRQPGATYFVTFRQDDSIPASVLAEWHDIRQRWYGAHGLDPKLKDTAPDQFAKAYSRIPEGVRQAFERDQTRMLHEELDRCHGSCVLQLLAPRCELVKSLSFFHGERLWLGDSVVMSNHVHAIVIPFGGWELEVLLGSIKKWTSRWIHKWLEGQPKNVHPVGPTRKKPRFWQHESYDRIIRDSDELAHFRRYIAMNPKDAMLPDTKYSYGVADWLDTGSHCGVSV